YNIDYNFWASKNVLSGVGGFEQQKRWIYEYRMSYWDSIVRKKIPELVSSGICIEIPEDPFYSCDTPELNMQSPQNLMKANSELSIAAEIMTSNLSIASDVTVDYSGTLDDAFLFNDHSYTIFEAPFGPNRIIPQTFKGMCVSGFSFNSVSDDSSVYANNIGRIRQNAQLIELTSDIGKLNEFSRTKVFIGSGTDTTAGLLTAAKVVSKGDNPQKLIIVITDGEDSGQLSELSTQFHTKYKMCQKIVDGIEAYSSQTKSVKIFYISLSAKDNNEKRLAFWRDNCVGSDGAFTATDYGSLRSVISSIFQKSGLQFINQ
ncbi:VWA domain-containing protein, partial [Salmonella enterica subsp. enterica]|nr:VWA domain-containing protein [Salmonella enterica subsp. enterica]